MSITPKAITDAVPGFRFEKIEPNRDDIEYNRPAAQMDRFEFGGPVFYSFMLERDLPGYEIRLEQNMTVGVTEMAKTLRTAADNLTALVSDGESDGAAVLRGTLAGLRDIFAARIGSGDIDDADLHAWRALCWACDCLGVERDG